MAARASDAESTSPAAESPVSPSAHHGEAALYRRGSAIGRGAGRAGEEEGAGEGTAPAATAPDAVEAANPAAGEAGRVPERTLPQGRFSVATVPHAVGAPSRSAVTAQPEPAAAEAPAGTRPPSRFSVASLPLAPTASVADAVAHERQDKDTVSPGAAVAEAAPTPAATEESATGREERAVVPKKTSSRFAVKAIAPDAAPQTAGETASSDAAPVTGLETGSEDAPEGATASDAVLEGSMGAAPPPVAPETARPTPANALAETTSEHQKPPVGRTPSRFSVRRVSSADTAANSPFSAGSAAGEEPKSRVFIRRVPPAPALDTDQPPPTAGADALVDVDNAAQSVTMPASVDDEQRALHAPSAARVGQASTDHPPAQPGQQRQDAQTPTVREEDAAGDMDTKAPEDAAADVSPAHARSRFVVVSRGEDNTAASGDVADMDSSAEGASGTNPGGFVGVPQTSSAEQGAGAGEHTAPSAAMPVAAAATSPATTATSRFAVTREQPSSALPAATVPADDQPQQASTPRRRPATPRAANHDEDDVLDGVSQSVDSTSPVQADGSDSDKAFADHSAVRPQTPIVSHRHSSPTSPLPPAVDAVMLRHASPERRFAGRFSTQRASFGSSPHEAGDVPSPTASAPPELHHVGVDAGAVFEATSPLYHDDNSSSKGDGHEAVDKNLAWHDSGSGSGGAFASRHAGDTVADGHLTREARAAAAGPGLQRTSSAHSTGSGQGVRRTSSAHSTSWHDGIPDTGAEQTPRQAHSHESDLLGGLSAPVSPDVHSRSAPAAFELGELPPSNPTASAAAAPADAPPASSDLEASEHVRNLGNLFAPPDAVAPPPSETETAEHHAEGGASRDARPGRASFDASASAYNQPHAASALPRPKVDYEQHGLGAVDDGTENQFDGTLRDGYRRHLSKKLLAHQQKNREQTLVERKQRRTRPWYRRMLGESSYGATNGVPLAASKGVLLDEEEKEPRFKLNTTVFLLVLGGLAAVLEFLIDFVGSQIALARSYLPDLDQPYGSRIAIYIASTLALVMLAMFVTHAMGGRARGSGIPVSSIEVWNASTRNFV